MKSLHKKMSSCEFSLHEIIQHANTRHSEEIPTLLHCAAKCGLKEVALLLMNCQGADQISRITNKYGEDPATIAEKHGHKEIQNIIQQLTIKFSKDDVNVEHLDKEPEEIYVDMVPYADGEGCDHGSKESTFDEREEISHNETLEENDKVYPQNEDSNENPQLTGYAKSPEDISEGEINCKESDANQYRNDTDKTSGEVENREKKKIKVFSDSDSDDNILLSHLFGYDKEEAQNVYHIYTPDLPQSDNATVAVEMKDGMMLKYSQVGSEEECKHETESWNEQDKCTEEITDNNEEPLIVASTDDDLYVVFETSTKDTQQKQTYSVQEQTVQEPTSVSAIECGAFYTDPDYTEEIDKNLPWNKNMEYPEEGNRNEDDFEPHIVATTEDDVYIAFQTSIKDKPKGQGYVPALQPIGPEPPFNQEWESGEYSIYNAVGRVDSSLQDTHWDEASYSYTYDEEDPYSFAYEDDDNLYMEFPFETTDAESGRGNKSSFVHRAPAPAPRHGVPPTDSHASYISQVFQQKQEDKKMYGTIQHPAILQKMEEKKLYSTVSYPATGKMPTPTQDIQSTFQQSLPTGQDELILLQEKVKMGILSMDEALHKFQLWQNEKASLDLLQKKKIRQLRDSIIGDKPEDEKLYDKITIVHQPNVLPAKQRMQSKDLDNSIYQRPFNPAALKK
ncbi:B-cell scaffold protein with ankyrin repeats [Pelobates fuscus]|uniref:B-cell scaffold protein with ankyrin repeats n=1 Tax=Pelobates fuscus TaxID=191477 RepID=UPI002FE4C813